MRRLRMGMTRDGPGAFIGPIHRIAAELDREIELVAGVFSSDPDRSRVAGESYRIEPTRAYGSLEAMFGAERSRDDGIDFVAVVSPDHHHLPAVRAAQGVGLPVMSDKTMTATWDEAQELAGLVAGAGLPYGLTYTYSGYPLVREMKARIAAGALGAIRKVVVEAFANLYRDFAALLRGDAAPLLPGIEDGLRGMAFIHTAVNASRDRAGWTRFQP